jgi:hypothetical protein
MQTTLQIKGETCGVAIMNGGGTDRDAQIGSSRYGNFETLTEGGAHVHE